MKQLGNVQFYGILLLMSIVTYVLAQGTSDPEVSEPGLSIKEISSSDVKIEWTDFTDETSYMIELIGNENCTKDNYMCTEGPCEIDIIGMGCIPIDIPPCSDITYNVFGKTTNVKKSLSTRLAPWIKTQDWKLNVSLTEETTVLLVSWGPPNNQDSSDVSCATHVTVATNCSEPDNQPVYDLVHVAQGNVSLDVSNCPTGIITVTVIYLSEVEGIPTTSKETKDYDYEAPITTTPTTTTTTTPTTTTTDADPESLSGGGIAGIVIGSLAGVALIGGVIFCYVKKMLCFKSC